MRLNLFLLLVLITLKSSAQNPDVWIAFEDKDNELFGYKNSKGEIMIPPKFDSGLGIGNKFDKIVALNEYKDGAFERYYMLKDGTKFGRDSLYLFDATFDCESEGLIKFRDSKTEKIGMFNEFGKVAIPSNYNDITRFKNGLAIGRINAVKEHLDENHNHAACNHWSWVGGKGVLINNKNEILIDDFPLNKNLDFYSLIISDTSIEDPVRVNFIGVNKKYYSFIDNEKLFKNFLQTKFLKDLNLKNLIEHSYQNFIYWSKDKAWNSMSNEIFIKQNLNILKERLSLIKNNKTDYLIKLEDSFPMPEDMYAQFIDAYDNCGNWDTSRFPIFEIIISHKDSDNDFLFQDFFTFIKIGNNIKLISCTIRNAE